MVLYVVADALRLLAEFGDRLFSLSILNPLDFLLSDPSMSCQRVSTNKSHVSSSSFQLPFNPSSLVKHLFQVNIVLQFEDIGNFLVQTF